ncbi:beta-aspartyl-peptidase [Oscillibacter sp. MSJ-2]|uniref:Isoaspartyl dipeptidase n=1 Tax=Dysosmobacter acutus TaxID=2841504 RepID=A0ABS6F674_9FIRM|nr:beta-aspartyl-peptidase [Dysosmobacter acutus]MBU5625573.1 beta-aspartyl-peptidase [Dysosmobacter acutus]
MKLFQNADVYAPSHLGKKDILVEGGRIARIDDAITDYDSAPDVERFDLGGKRLVPGYIDLHVHVTGGGGEQGPASRTPEASISTLLDCGVTTVVGLLGTDGISRSLENLLAKTRALTEEGLTCYMLTGSYGWPTTTLTGSVERDMVLIPEIIGAKIAVSDHRSSNPQGEDLIALATAVRRAGLLAPCCGLLTMHMGSGKGRLDPVFYALDHSDVPAKTFLPTHMNFRGRELMDDGIRLVKMGGTMDFTAGGTMEENVTLAGHIRYCLEQGMPLSGLTVSSDGYGSQPRFNEKGECVGLTYSTPRGLHQLIQALVCQEVLPLEDALTLVTANPAGVLDKSGVKGSVVPGADADFVIYGQDFSVESVVAKGERAVWEGRHLIRGRFEA